MTSQNPESILDQLLSDPDALLTELATIRRTRTTLLVRQRLVEDMLVAAGVDVPPNNSGKAEAGRRGGRAKAARRMKTTTRKEA